MSKASLPILSAALHALPLTVAVIDQDGVLIFKSGPDMDSLPALGSEKLGDLFIIGQGAHRLEDGPEGIFYIHPLTGEGIDGVAAIFHPDEKTEPVAAPESFPYMSEAMTGMMEQIKRLSMVEMSVLIIGEHGLYKEGFAHYLHRSSGRAIHPFIALDCHDNMGGMLEAGLFGMEGEAGLLELCAGGTIYLDEISGLPMELQTRLLGIIRSREFESSSGIDIPFTTRLIASTSRDLHRLVEEGLFSEELLFRIGAMQVSIPPLRERSDDILPLAEYFLKAAGGEGIKLAKDAEKALISYYWPGNDRELNQAISHAVRVCAGDEIRMRNLPFRPQKNLEGFDNGFKRGRIEALLKLYGNDLNGKKRAAKELGIGLSTLYRILKG